MKNIEMYKINTEEILNENNLLKDRIDQLEVDFTDQELLIRQLKSDKEQLKVEVDRVKRNRTLSRDSSRRSLSKNTPIKDIEDERAFSKNIGNNVPKTHNVHFDIPTKRPVTSRDNFSNPSAKSLYEEYMLKMGNSQAPGLGSPRKNQTSDLKFSNIVPRIMKESMQNKGVENYHQIEEDSAAKAEYFTPQKPQRSRNSVQYAPVQRNSNQGSSDGFRQALGIGSSETNVNNTQPDNYKEEIQIDELPPAGLNSCIKDRKYASLIGDRQGSSSNRNLMPSFSQASLNKTTHQVSVKEVQAELLKFQIEKQNLENEYNRIPRTYMKSIAQRQRKNVLEQKIEEVDKQINEAKLFIRRKKTERERSL